MVWFHRQGLVLFAAEAYDSHISRDGVLDSRLLDRSFRGCLCSALCLHIVHDVWGARSVCGDGARCNCCAGSFDVKSHLTNSAVNMKKGSGVETDVVWDMGHLRLVLGTWLVRQLVCGRSMQRVAFVLPQLLSCFTSPSVGVHLWRWQVYTSVRKQGIGPVYCAVMCGVRSMRRLRHCRRRPRRSDSEGSEASRHADVVQLRYRDDRPRAQQILNRAQRISGLYSCARAAQRVVTVSADQHIATVARSVHSCTCCVGALHGECQAGVSPRQKNCLELFGTSARPRVVNVA